MQVGTVGQVSGADSSARSLRRVVISGLFIARRDERRAPGGAPEQNSPLRDGSDVVSTAVPRHSARGNGEVGVVMKVAARSYWLAGLAAAGILGSGLAAALVTEPDGQVVPIDGGGGIQLRELFAARGEPIDWQQDAVTKPETFSPLCDFSAEFLLREAGGQYPLGWYNADPNAVVGPPANLIYEIVACNTPPGAVIDSQDIKSHPAYAGGEIGFALMNGSGCVSFANPFSFGQIHYTEPRFNVKYLNNPLAPFFMSLVYDSKVEPNAFYVAFEDGNTNAFSFSNDGDFNDFVVLLHGLACAGGGGPCSTGELGVCGPGVEVCRNGALECEGLSVSGAESCDGLDNDCDGNIDNGDLCAEDEVCDHGVCVEQCGSAEFPCQNGLVCNESGYCVEEACATVDCQAGEICVGGNCQAPCDGIVCPHGQVCRFGDCVDPCVGVTCDAAEACVEGVCRPLCACAPCGAALECDNGSGLCVPLNCSGMNCPPGTHCETNAGCVDDCAGAKCPSGQLCVDGDCVDESGGGTGTGGGGGGQGAGGGDGTVIGGGGDGNGNGNGATDGGGPAPTSQGDVGGEAAGCGCHTVAASGSVSPYLVALFAGAAAMSRRRRRAS